MLDKIKNNAGLYYIIFTIVSLVGVIVNVIAGQQFWAGFCALGVAILSYWYFSIARKK